MSAHVISAQQACPLSLVTLRQALATRLRPCSFLAKPGVWCLQVWIGERKVGAVGIRISRGVSTHGIALNVNTDLSWFDHIVPCGQKEKKVTSLAQMLGCPVSMDTVRMQLTQQLTSKFGHTHVCAVDPEALLSEIQELRRDAARESVT